MLSWIFKKKDTSVPAKTAAPADKGLPAAAAPQAAAERAAERQAQQVAAAALWSQRLEQALGDDRALLALAKESPLVDIKLAAVRALADEASLQAAEREFRSHDRRVHQAAKQRHAALKARRDTAERAAGLVRSATALLDDPLIPANRLVELDRGWQALDADLVDAAVKAEFAELSARLTALTHARGEQQAAVQRWTTQATQVLERLGPACLEAAAGRQTRDELALAGDGARQILAALPAPDTAPALAAQLQAALTQAAAIGERLALLDDLQQPPPAVPAADTVATDAPLEPSVAPAAGTAPGGEAAEKAEEAGAAEAAPSEPAPESAAAARSSAAAERWKALPAIADAGIVRLLNERFEAWQRAQAPRRAAPAEKRAPRNETPKAARPQRSTTLEPLLLQAEAALAAGQLALTHQHLMAMEPLAHPEAAVEPAQRSRLHAVQAEYARLKGWQQWGGGRARDDLVLEAEALAASTAAAEASGSKLPIKAQTEAIDDLRKRWKELDRLGGATSQALWKRFDEAAKLAYQPVAAHLAQLETARQANLATRQALLDTLDAVPLVDAGLSDPAAVSAGWKELARALDHFQVEWRKLGPVEHTVPRKAQKALLDRQATSLARVEQPLHEARRLAQAERERLVARAQALGSEAAPHAAELVHRVRELQAEWQQHARSLPLNRQVENSLWAEFKAATDAVFAQREAAFSARDAVLKEHLAAREALVARVEALDADTPAGEIKRTLAEANAQWRNAGEAPRQQATALEQRFRAACMQAQALLADSAQRLWQATCDSLLAKLALCEAREAGGEADVDAAWNALPALPPLWERALAERKSSAPGGETDCVATDAALLQLEAALDLPSPAEHQAARRELKLLAMKAALEGRQAAGSGPAPVDQLMAGVLGHKHLDDTRRARLRALLAGLRAAQPPGRG